MPVRAVALGGALVGLGIDQLIKLASVTYLEPGVDVPVLGSVLQLRLVRNPGAAFGMGADATIVFSVFAIIATLACLLAGLPRVKRMSHAITLALLLAGITGNLVDRLFQPPAPLHGHVVDMFQVPFFAIFNFADVCITVAAGLIIVAGLFGKDKPEGAEPTS